MKPLFNHASKTNLPDYLEHKKPKIAFTPSNIRKDIFIMRLILIFLAFIPAIINMPLVSFAHEISVKVEGSGVHTILNPDYYICPDHIYLDTSDIKGIDGTDCHLAKIPDNGNEFNTLRLVWDINPAIYPNLSLYHIFENLTNILEVDISNYDTSRVNDTHQMFLNCSSLTSINLANINTSLVGSMRLMFGGCVSLEELDVSRFDTSKVTDMHFMFSDCKLIKNLDVSRFDTSNVEHFEGLFAGMESLEEINVRNFDTSKGISMHGMFYRCITLTSLDLSSFYTPLVTDMSLMFYGDEKLQIFDISNFDTSSVSNTNFMFGYCKKLPHLNLNHFRTSNLKTMNQMFYECNSLTSLQVMNFDTSQVTDMERLFFGCNNVPFLNLTSFDTSKVCNMSHMFAHMDRFASVDLSSFDTSSLLDCRYMFKYNFAMTSLNLTHFDTSKVTDMSGMFFYCLNLKELNLSNFDTHFVQNMESMFYRCHSMTSLNVSNFNTELVKSMKEMFFHCESLTSLDLSSFKALFATTTESMFEDCHSMNSLIFSGFNGHLINTMKKMFLNCHAVDQLDLSSFDTQAVQTMEEMFHNCKALISLDLSSFNVQNVQTMKEMFYYCNSLTSLGLSSFVTTKTNDMYCMFRDTQKLREIHLPNIDTTSTPNMVGFFFYCPNLNYIDIRNYKENNYNYNHVAQALDYVPENVVVCIENPNLNSTNYFKELVKKRCHIIYCGDDWRTKQKKMVYGTNLVCVQDCSEYDYEIDGWCYKYPEGYKPTTIIIPTTNKDITTTDNIHSITTDINNLSTNKIFESTYLSKVSTNKIVESTYLSKESTNKIVESTYLYKESTNKIIESSNLYKESTNIYTSQEITEKLSTSKPDDNLINTSDNKLDDLTDKKTDKETKDNLDKISSDISEKITTNNQEDKIDNSSDNLNTEKLSSDMGIENNEQLYQEIINNYLTKLSTDNKSDKLVFGLDNYAFHISTPEIEKKSLSGAYNNSNQVSKIDLGFCEDILKEHYHINPNDSLIIIKFEKITNISTERTLQYKVYEPYNKTKLDLSLCDNTTISIYVPLELSEELKDLYNQLKDKGYNLFDINGQFYRDICTPFTTPNGTDILLDDRITYYYYHNNETICQSNCEFSNYSFESQYLKCDCDTSNSKINTKEINKFTPKTFYESFYDILKYSNYKVLYCYKLAFHINSVTINKGSIIAIIYFCIYLIFLFIYCNEGIRQFKLYVARKLFNYPFIKHDFDNLISKTDQKLPNYKNKIKIKSKSSKNLKVNNDYNNFPPKRTSQTKIASKKSLKKYVYRNKKKNSMNHERLMSEKNVLTTTEFQTDKPVEKKTDDKINKDIQEENLDNFELNELDYESALKLDKRNCIQIYWSFLRREHLIVFTFFIRNDYNLVFTKFVRFIFLLCTDMAMNMYFFSDETMHKMYLDYGKYNFIQQIAQIAFSTIATQIMEVFICYLSLTDKHYYEIKNLKKNERYNLFSILKCIKRKITIFFIFTFLMFAFYWYSIACFCAVYPNTQKAFIIDSFSSFILGLLYPLFLYTFPSLFRFIALRAKVSCIYSISNIIPFF